MVGIGGSCLCIDGYKQAKLGTGKQVHLKNYNNLGILFVVRMKFEQGKSLAAARSLF